MASIHSGLGPSRSIITQERAPGDLSKYQSNGENFSLGSLFPDVPSLCQVDKNLSSAAGEAA